jgi:hypothetical protein
MIKPLIRITGIATLRNINATASPGDPMLAHLMNLKYISTPPD